MISIRPEKKEPMPDLYQSAYLYQGSIAPPAMSQSAQQSQSSAIEPLSNKDTIALAKPAKKRLLHATTKKTRTSSVMSMTYQFLEQYNQENMNTAEDKEEPIYLVGDLNSPVNPLIKLLGRALSKNFNYPRIAGTFGIKGRAVVSLVLHPNGQLTHIRLLQSTESHDLDTAALYAAINAPVVRGADKFLSKPKRFVVGFVFR
jgi:TonB family protein